MDKGFYEARFKENLLNLQDMGFLNYENNLKALKDKNNNLE